MAKTKPGNNRVHWLALAEHDRILTTLADIALQRVAAGDKTALAVMVDLVVALDNETRLS